MYSALLAIAHLTTSTLGLEFSWLAPVSRTVHVHIQVCGSRHKRTNYEK